MVHFHFLKLCHLDVDASQPLVKLYVHLNGTYLKKIKDASVLGL